LEPPGKAIFLIGERQREEKREVTEKKEGRKKEREERKRKGKIRLK